MKVSIGIGGAASGRKRDFDEQVDYVVEAEKLGVDSVWSAEAWGHDAISPLAYLAARTSRIRLGTGIIQISARVPAMIAMTALTMAAISNDRFILGLGASGPQVVEGLQGRPFKAPLTRMKETVEIIKLAFAGEKIEYHGKYHELPLPGGQGKALKLSQPGNPNIPIYLATLGPRALEYTGAAADGWLGTSFTPEHAAAHLDYLRRGAEGAGRSLADIDIQVGGTVAFGDDLDALVEPLKPAMAFTLGAMGSAKTNFYNDAFKRGGWEATALEVQRLWIAGKRPEAIAKVPTGNGDAGESAGRHRDGAQAHPRLPGCRSHDAARQSPRARPRGETRDARACDGPRARLTQAFPSAAFELGLALLGFGRECLASVFGFEHPEVAFGFERNVPRKVHPFRVNEIRLQCAQRDRRVIGKPIHDRIDFFPKSIIRKNARDQSNPKRLGGVELARQEIEFAGTC